MNLRKIVEIPPSASLPTAVLNHRTLVRFFSLLIDALHMKFFINLNLFVCFFVCKDLFLPQFYEAEDPTSYHVLAILSSS